MLYYGRWAVAYLEIEVRFAMSAQFPSLSQYPSFLTPQEVSELLRVSVYTVRRWIHEGQLPAYKVGRAWRISESAIGEWLSQNQSDLVTRR